MTTVTRTGRRPSHHLPFPYYDIGILDFSLSLGHDTRLIPGEKPPPTILPLLDNGPHDSGFFSSRTGPMDFDIMQCKCLDVGSRSGRYSAISTYSVLRRRCLSVVASS